MMSSESTQSQAINPPSPTEVMASVPFSSSCFPTSSSSEYRSAVGADPLLLPSFFVQTPSYSDSLFSSSEPQNDVDHPSTSGCASTSGNLKIIVSDPKKENGASASLVPGSGSFFTYLITTRTCVGVGGAVFSVRRRFRDVVTLADRLAESHRGYFIPLRPEKSVIESQVMQKHDFIEHRREALEKYLWRLAAHPVIGRSEELRIFLLGQGNLPLTLTTDTTSRMQEWSLSLPEKLSEDESSVRVAPKDAMFPARGGGDLLRMFKELKQSISNDLVGKKTLVTEDKTFLERKGRIQDFALHLNASWDRAETLVKAQGEIAETMGALGLSFVKLVKLENSESAFGSENTWPADVKVLATGAVKASRFYRELNSHSIRYLDTLQEYVVFMLSIQNAFSERSNALLMVQTLLSDLGSWSARAEKLEAASSRFFGCNESRVHRLEEIRKTIRIIEVSKSCATKEHEKIRENNRYELERFERKKQNDFMCMLRGLTLNQAGYFQKIADVWERVASETRHYAKRSC